MPKVLPVVAAADPCAVGKFLYAAERHVLVHKRRKGGGRLFSVAAALVTALAIGHALGRDVQ